MPLRRSHDYPLKLFLLKLQFSIYLQIQIVSMEGQIFDKQNQKNSVANFSNKKLVQIEFIIASAMVTSWMRLFWNDTIHYTNFIINITPWRLSLSIHQVMVACGRLPPLRHEISTLLPTTSTTSSTLSIATVAGGTEIQNKINFWMMNAWFLTDMKVYCWWKFCFCCVALCRCSNVDQISS